MRHKSAYATGVVLGLEKRNRWRGCGEASIECLFGNLVRANLWGNSYVLVIMNLEYLKQYPVRLEIHMELSVEARAPVEIYESSIEMTVKTTEMDRFTEGKIVA